MAVTGFVAERYSKVYLDLPAGDPDLFDDCPHESLALLEVEVVEAVSDTCGKVGYSPVELVAGRQFVVAGLELALFGQQTGPAACDLVGSALQFWEGDQPSLVQVGQTPAFRLDGFELAGEAGELSVEHFVCVDGVVPGEGRLAGQEKFGA